MFWLSENGYQSFLSISRSRDYYKFAVKAGCEGCAAGIWYSVLLFLKQRYSAAILDLWSDPDFATRISIRSRHGPNICVGLKYLALFQRPLRPDRRKVARNIRLNVCSQLLQGLYDLLRPYIISIYHVETLSELCSILKLEMLDDHIMSNQEELKGYG